MSISMTFWKYRRELVQTFHLATLHGMLDTWRRCERLGTSPQEPDFVAGIVLESAPLIRSALIALLAPQGISVSMSAVFCHQTPQVSFDVPQVTCELGDLMFAYVHTTRDGLTRRNAVLFQAKTSAAQPYRVSAGESDQLRLYMDWPDFVYTKSSRLNGQSRTVTPKTPHAGAQYLLIDDRSPDQPTSGLLGLPETYPIGCCVPDLYLRDHNDLASELFNLLIFRTGRAFDDRSRAAKQNDWSQVVWDLLESAVKKGFSRKNSGRSNAPRSVSDALSMLDGAGSAAMTSEHASRTVTEILGNRTAARAFHASESEPPRDRDRYEERNEPNGGVSVILIETSEVESER
jgi:hypothetical protein